PFGRDVRAPLESERRTPQAQAAAIAARRDAVLAIEEVLWAGEEAPLRAAIRAHLDQRLAPADRQSGRAGTLRRPPRSAAQHLTRPHRTRCLPCHRRREPSFDREVRAHPAL